MAKTKPELTVRIGSVSASVFIREVESKNGKRTVRNVNLQRRFQAENGEWKSSSSFRLADLPVAIAVLSRALEYVASKEADHES